LSKAKSRVAANPKKIKGKKQEQLNNQLLFFCFHFIPLNQLFILLSFSEYFQISWLIFVIRFESGKMTDKIIIAIDGPSSCGKSTLAKDLAKELNYKYIDTGAMYRAITLYFLRNNISEKDHEKVKNALETIEIEFKKYPDGNQYTILNGVEVEDEIRSMEVSKNVSQVSAIKEVRDAMVKQQQRLGKDKGLIMDGRDIGTIVFPDAELKIFLIADEEERIHRRFYELRQKGLDITEEEVEKNLLSRDYLDSHREVAPLRKADDAIELNNTDMNRKEQVDYVLKLVRDLQVK
jgi:CMP/dCMP kinase